MQRVNFLSTNLYSRVKACKNEAKNEPGVKKNV